MSALPSLVARDVTKAYAGRVVLDGVDVVANPGQPLGVVGENGAGKSTLLRLLASVEPPDAGTVIRPRDLGYLPQDPEFVSHMTLGQVLDDALAPLHDAVRRLEELSTRLGDTEAQDEYSDVLAWAEHHDAWDADRRAILASQHLGLDDLSRDRLVSELSGGERSRLALAAIITRRPGCVLLDEPTNHLDDEAIGLVEDFCRGLPGVVLVASHDRVFLDQACSVIVDLDRSYFGVDGSGGSRFNGNYTAYLASKRASRSRWQMAFLDQWQEINELRAAARTSARAVAPHNRPPRDGDKYIYAFKGANVARTIARRVRNVEQRLAVLDRDPIPKPPPPLRFDQLLARSGEVAGPVVVICELLVPGRLRLDRLVVEPGEHLLVTGSNGSGKSTLLAVIAGRLQAEGGVDVRARRVAILEQDIVFDHPERNACQVYAAALEGRARLDGPPALGELGLLHPRELAKPVGSLSVGQQRRLGLAITVASKPDLLLLDEPTNHLSLALADELEDALRRTAGTVIATSHDRWLRRHWKGPQHSLDSERSRTRGNGRR